MTAGHGAAALDTASAAVVLQQVVQLTRQMLLAAESGNWEALVALEQQRQACLQPAMGALTAFPAVEQTRTQLEWLQAANQQLEERTRARMVELQALAASRQTERKLRQAYQML